MSYADRDKYGIYQRNSGASSSPGPGPALMGADTLIGDSVVNASEEDLGDIKEIMLDMQTGQVAYAVLAFSASAKNCLPCPGAPCTWTPSITVSSSTSIKPA
jgi:hypothetical protein